MPTTCLTSSDQRSSWLPLYRRGGRALRISSGAGAGNAGMTVSWEFQSPFSPPRHRVACGVSEAAASACHDTMLGAKAPGVTIVGGGAWRRQALVLKAESHSERIARPHHISYSLMLSRHTMPMSGYAGVC
jgi:hypothetical protein